METTSQFLTGLDIKSFSVRESPQFLFIFFFLQGIKSQIDSYGSELNAALCPVQSGTVGGNEL